MKTFLLCVLASWRLTGATLDWDASPKSLNVTEYQVHLGTNSRTYVLHLKAPSNQLALTNLAPGQWFACVTAHNASEACPFWETSDPADDAPEITFTISTNRERVLLILSSTDAAAPIGSWPVKTSVRVPVPAGHEFYALKFEPEPIALLPVRTTAARLRQTSGSKTGKLIAPPPLP